MGDVVALKIRDKWKMSNESGHLSVTYLSCIIVHSDAIWPVDVSVYDGGPCGSVTIHADLLNLWRFPPISPIHETKKRRYYNVY